MNNKLTDIFFEDICIYIYIVPQTPYHFFQHRKEDQRHFYKAERQICPSTTSITNIGDLRQQRVVGLQVGEWSCIGL